MFVLPQTLESIRRWVDSYRRNNGKRFCKEFLQFKRMDHNERIHLKERQILMQMWQTGN